MLSFVLFVVPAFVFANCSGIGTDDEQKKRICDILHDQSDWIKENFNGDWLIKYADLVESDFLYGDPEVVWKEHVEKNQWYHKEIRARKSGRKSDVHFYQWDTLMLKDHWFLQENLLNDTYPYVNTLRNTLLNRFPTWSSFSMLNVSVFETHWPWSISAIIAFVSFLCLKCLKWNPLEWTNTKQALAHILWCGLFLVALWLVILLDYGRACAYYNAWNTPSIDSIIMVGMIIVAIVEFVVVALVIFGPIPILLLWQWITTKEEDV
jgi:hypothetical protein